MAVHTRGYVSSEVSEQDVKKTIESELNTVVTATEYESNSYKLIFIHGGEDRILHVHVDLDDLPQRFGKERRTILSIIHRENSVEIMTAIMKHFGGELCLNDIRDEWIVVEKQ